MNKLISRIWAPIALVVDIFLMIDIGTDLLKKYKDRRAKKLATVSATTDAPAPEETSED